MGLALIAVLAGLCLSASTATAAPKRFFGVNVQNPGLSDADYVQMGKSGVGTLRLGFFWLTVQPKPGQFYWGTYDERVARAAAQGITILPYLAYTPAWVARRFDHRRCVASECSTFAPRSTRALRAWQRFASAAAERYGPGGEFWDQHPELKPRPIRAWQIWNEQNSRTFFKPAPDPRRYSKLLRRASRVIRRQHHGAVVILGGMFGTPGGGTQRLAIDAATFIRKLYNVRHIKRSFSGVALHPYSHTVHAVAHQIRIARRVLRQAHDSSTALWISEIGWASGGQPSSLNVRTKRRQAQRLSKVYKLFLRNRKSWHIRTVDWFSWQDVPEEESFCFFCAHSGLLTKKHREKPALRTYRRLARTH